MGNSSSRHVLCAECQKINFVGHTEPFQGEEYSSSDSWAVLGTFANEKSCAGCRLIHAAMHSTNSQDLKLDIATIRVGLYRRGNGPWKERAHNLIRPLPLDRVIEVKDGERILGTILRAQTDNKDLNKNTSAQGNVVEGRIVTPMVDVDLVKSWAGSCKLQHFKCGTITRRKKDFKTLRLIDVSQMKLVTVFTETVISRYVALSYVWGNGVTALLKKRNHVELGERGSLRRLDIPQTVSDAMQFTKAIGERYLWVDTLCIMQDDLNDKHRYLPVMDSIFGCAELVIIAAHGSHANAGLPGISTERTMPQISEEINGVRFRALPPRIDHLLYGSTWNSRGWTFQEAKFARRSVIFTESLVYWGCRMSARREDYTVACDASVREVQAEHSSLGSLLGNPIVDCATWYCILASEFSARQFTKQSDVVWGFLGTLRFIAPRIRESSFIWGLPKSRLDTTILWDHGSVFELSRQGPHEVRVGNTIYGLDYPSWSWFSTTDKISFQDPMGHNTISKVRWFTTFHWRERASKSVVRSSDHTKFDRLPASKRFNAHESVTGSDIMQYSYLYFVAHTAPLKLERKQEQGCYRDLKASAESIVDGDKRQEAMISLPGGEVIGTIWADSSMFCNADAVMGEFMLLSAHAKRKVGGGCRYRDESDGNSWVSFHHVPDCKHVESYNVMLIERIGNIAYRRGLTRIARAKWDKVDTTVKKITLG